MKTDKYTKIVLTIIAFCLTVQMIEKFIQPALARNYNQAQDVNIVSVNGITIFGGKIPVKND